MNAWLRRFALWAIREFVRRQLVAANAAAAATASAGAQGLERRHGPRIRGLVRDRDAWGRPRLAARALDVRDAVVVSEPASPRRQAPRGTFEHTRARARAATNDWPPSSPLGARVYEMER